MEITFMLKLNSLMIFQKL